MACSRLLHLTPRRIVVVKRLFPSTPLLYGGFSTISSDPPPPTPPTPKPTSLSARMSFIFDQIDQIESNQRSANEEKDETLQRIRAWRQSKNQNSITPVTPTPSDSDSLDYLKSELDKSTEDDFRVSGAVEKDNEVELVHPWAEWIEFMERLVHQNYFDYRRKDEDGMMERLGVEIKEDGSDGGGGGKNLMRDFKAVQNAVLNFGRDRFDILRSLSRQDLQLLVGYGCPSTDKRVIFSAKLLRKHVHLDEGDVCSSCNLRNSCEKAYLLTNKEDESRTIDVMRILLTYGFEPIYGSVENKSLLKMKSVKTVIRKLLHEVVKLSAVPIDPNLPPPVIKKPPPKVKQPPPPPRKKIGRNDIEMKKGDWLCPKCDFMNFAKNTVCLHCDAKRPKRQLLPGEWECPQCNFLNYRRNTVCFHCEHNRPPETYADNQFTEKQHGPGFRTRSKIPDRANISNAWNFDFDDDESDGADVAAFENADSMKLDEDYSLDKRSYENSRRLQNNMEMRGNHPRMTEHSDPSSRRPGMGFNDFDEEDEDDVDNYELVTPNEEPKISRVDFSELESDSGSEDRERNTSPRDRTRFSAHGKKQHQRRASFTGSEDEIDFNSDDDLPIHPKYKSTHVAANVKKQNRSRDVGISYDDDDDDIGLSSDIDDEAPRSIKKENHRLGSNGMNRTKGARSSFKAGPFSNDDRSYDNGYKQRDRAFQHSPRDESREWGPKKSSFDRRSGSQRSNRDDYEDSYRGKTKNAKGGRFSKSPKPDRKHTSFDKRGARSSNFDDGSNSSYLDNERHWRPRNNVR